MNKDLVEKVYNYYCEITEYDEIPHPYLSEETNYMLAFDEWASELDMMDIADLREKFPEITEDNIDQLKKDISDYVEIYLLKWSGMKPIENIR